MYQNRYCLCRVLNIVPISVWVSSKFPGFLQLSEYMSVDKFTIKLAQGMNACVDICVHGAL